MFKRFVITLAILSLVFGGMPPLKLFAGSDISYEGRVCRDLGILKGETGVVDSDYLQTRPSRLQSAIMFLRLKGLEQEALSYTGGRNFNDAKVIAWKEGRNILSYLKDHPELGWIGDGTNFMPYSLIDSRAYYKVLLESLGYKQKIDGEGDFSWDAVLDFAADKGLHRVAGVKDFTVNSLAIATVEALKTRMKNSNKTLIEYLVETGRVDRYDAVELGLYSEGLDVDVKEVKAISNSKVEVVFEQEVRNSEAADEDLYEIRNLNIRDVNVKNRYAVIIDTSAMSENATYTLVFNDRSYSFKGLKKDSQAPKLIKAECRDTETVELSFDRVLDNMTAQDADTYSISGVKVKSAELDSTNTKVRLAAEGILAGRSYELKIHGIRNGDGVTAKLITKRFTGRADSTPPKLNKLTVLNNIRLLLEFSDSNGLDKASAEDLDNYRITSSDGDLEIISAKVKDRDEDDLWDSVELETESQTPGRTYTLRISGIADASAVKNEIAKEIKKDFRGKPIDKTGPVVDRSPKAIAGNIIEIVFKDDNALNIESACDPDSYEIDEDLYIEEIRVKDASDLYSQSGRTVYIITSGMEKSKTYTLAINGVEDEFGNELKTAYKKYRFKGAAKDSTPPYVTFVECIDSKNIEIRFDNILDETSAENTANYRIDGLALVTKARLLEDERTVRLTVSSLTSDKDHTIYMNNIKDISGNSLSGLSVSIVYNGDINDTDGPEVEYIDAVNEEELWVQFDEEVYAHNAKLKASGITFNQAGSVLEDGTVVVFKADSKMDDREYKVTSLTGVRDLRGNAYILEDDLEFEGTDIENDPPEVDYWEQINVKTFRVIFTEPVLLIGDGVSGIDNPRGVNLSWRADLNPEDEDDNEAYSTVDFIASKEIPADKEYEFDFTSMVSDYMGKGVYDENDDREGDPSPTILESYMEDDDDPYIEYVEAVTRTKAQVVFNEEISEDKPGSYKITYEDDDDRIKSIDISRVEVDSKDKCRVNIFTEDEMTEEYVYTLVPKTSACDIAGNRLDTDDVEIYFDGTNIMSSEYIQGVEFIGEYSFKVTKSSKIYRVSSLYELDTGGNILGGDLIDDASRINDIVYRITSKKPLLRDVRYKITVDGLEYRFYGGVQNGDIELELPEREITFDGTDTDKYDVEVYRANGEKLKVNEVHGDFLIDRSVRLRNGEYIYIYVIREKDGIKVFGTRVKVEGMPSASSSKEITSFGFKGLEPDAMGSIDEENKIIRISVPYGTKLENLAASFSCSEGALVKIGSLVQESGKTKNDFSKEVIYTVVAEDGSEASYRVLVSVLDSRYEKKIKSFVLKEFDPDIEGVIDHERRVITLEVPEGTDLKNLKPYIEVSEETVVSPKSGEAKDFSGPVIYKVTAKDGSEQSYTVNTIVRLSSENYIKAFRFEGVDAIETVIAGGRENTVNIRVPYNTGIKELVPIIAVSEGAVLEPGSGEKRDFTDEVTYTVTARDGSKRIYKVRVTVEPGSSEKDITSFSFPEFHPPVEGRIRERAKTITVTVPYGTDVTALKASFTVSPGARVRIGEVSQESGVTVNNFENPVIYTVVAQDGSTQDYTVIVNEAPSSEKLIKEFGFIYPAAAGIIDEANGIISVKVPYGTDLSRLVAVYNCSDNCMVRVGRVRQQSGMTVNSFERDVVYTVMAQDGSTRDYTVKVTAAGADEKRMESFSLMVGGAVIQGSIDEAGRTIRLVLPKGTGAAGLAAVFTYTGKAVTVEGIPQISGITVNDYGNPEKPVVYAVWDHKGMAVEYMVVVTFSEDGA